MEKSNSPDEIIEKDESKNKNNKKGNIYSNQAILKLL
jgi:hypothetical protein